MKDNQLRDVLFESGIIKFNSWEGNTYLQPVFLVDKINAIVDYLGIKFEHIPERIVVKKLKTEDNTQKEHQTEIQILRYEISALRLRMLNGVTGDDCYIREYAEVLKKLSGF